LSACVWMYGCLWHEQDGSFLLNSIAFYQL
jgi:hypothetical protein